MASFHVHKLFTPEASCSGTRRRGELLAALLLAGFIAKVKPAETKKSSAVAFHKQHFVVDSPLDAVHCAKPKVCSWGPSGNRKEAGSRVLASVTTAGRRLRLP
ncbi:hypothetical protein GUJ93_ZPchr0009g901 [Zizania palustris]|uniref:Uncharacterized protein n=1 Tax=Zizania palustris TaxID=103762 RepID=A0A8J5RSR5_ZIZPA|nr:hypothetical protein GUJ93_ZPchr0009g901 [Zizania palustris]